MGDYHMCEKVSKNLPKMEDAALKQVDRGT